MFERIDSVAQSSEQVPFTSEIVDSIFATDSCIKPVFHLRIFSREAKFSFVFIQLVPHGSSWETKDKWKIRLARKNSQVENRLYTCVKKSQLTLYRKSWVFSGYSGVLPQGMLTGCVGISPLTDPSTVAVLRDQTWVIRWLPEAPLESLRLDQVELHPS
jgi:hypothetical protein